MIKGLSFSLLIYSIDYTEEIPNTHPFTAGIDSPGDVPANGKPTGLLDLFPDKSINVK